MSKKTVSTNVKKYSIYSIIWWISLIPAITSFVLLLIDNKSDALEDLQEMFISFNVIFAILAIIGFVGKIFYWIKIFVSTKNLRTTNKNTLVTLLVLDIFIPFIPFYLYKKKVEDF